MTRRVVTPATVPVRRVVGKVVQDCVANYCTRSMHQQGKLSNSNVEGRLVSPSGVDLVWLANRDDDNLVVGSSSAIRVSSHTVESHVKSLTSKHQDTSRLAC